MSDSYTDLNSNTSHLRVERGVFLIFSCKDQIWLEPRTGMDPGPQSPNNKFVESGIKS